MADSTTNLDTIAEAQADKEVTANGLFDAGSHAMSFGRRQSSTDYLTWGYYGGRIGNVTVASGTIELTASRVTYIVANRTTGAVTGSTSAANWATPGTYARLYKVTAGASTPSSWEDHRFGPGGVFGGGVASAVAANQIEIPVPVGDVSTTITTGTRKAVIRAPVPFYLTDIKAGLATVSSSGAVTLDINNEGQSILATKLTIDASEKTNATAATAHAYIAEARGIIADAEISIDIDGAGTGAAGPVLWLIGQRGVGDPAWSEVAAALTMEGANGGTTFTDSTGLHTWAVTATTTTSTAQSMNSVSAAFAASSGLFSSSGAKLTTSAASALFNPATAPWSAEAWIRATSVASTPYLFHITSANNYSVILYLSGGAPKLWTVNATGGADRITGSALSTGTWYHLEVTYDLTTFRLFVDGASIGTSTTTNIPNADCVVCLGNEAWSPGASYAFSGHMQRFRFTRGLARNTAAYTRPVSPWLTY